MILFLVKRRHSNIAIPRDRAEGVTFSELSAKYGASSHTPHRFFITAANGKGSSQMIYVIRVKKIEKLCIAMMINNDINHRKARGCFCSSFDRRPSPIRQSRGKICKR
jgi:hypothetical protein